MIPSVETQNSDNFLPHGPTMSEKFSQAPQLASSSVSRMSKKKLLMLPRLIDGAAAYSSGQQRLNNIDQTH